MTIKVPLGLDERTISHFAERDPRTGQPLPDAELDGLSVTVKIAREEAESLVNLANAMRADRSQPVEAALVRTSDAALKAASRVAARIDAARARATAALAGIERKISAPPPPANPAAMHMEGLILNRLAAMPEKERTETVAAAFAARDERVIAAVLRGPAFLAGVGSAQQDIWRHRYAKEFHPADAARRDRLRKALEGTDRAGDIFVGLIRQMTNTEAARIAAANARAAEEALAANRTRGAA